jgi:hypothetical protein
MDSKTVTSTFTFSLAMGKWVSLSKVKSLGKKQVFYLIYQNQEGASSRQYPSSGYCFGASIDVPAAER